MACSSSAGAARSSSSCAVVWSSAAARPVARTRRGTQILGGGAGVGPAAANRLLIGQASFTAASSSSSSPASASHSHRQQRRSISVFPQPHQVLHARQTGRPLNGGQRPASDPDSFLPQSEAEKERERERLHRKIWLAMAGAKDFNEWEKQFALFRQKKLPYCEVTYTLLLHGYLLSPRHRSETAYLVLDEMRRVGFVHGAFLRFNEAMVNSFFELQQLNARPIPNSWQNVARLCYQSAQRFQKKRTSNMKKALLALPPNEVLALSPADVRKQLLLEVRKSKMLDSIGAAKMQDLVALSREGVENEEDVYLGGAGGGGQRLLDEGTNTSFASGQRSQDDLIMGAGGPGGRGGSDATAISARDTTSSADEIDIATLTGYVGAYEADDFCKAVEENFAQQEAAEELLLEDDVGGGRTTTSDSFAFGSGFSSLLDHESNSSSSSSSLFDEEDDMDEDRFLRDEEEQT